MKQRKRTKRIIRKRERVPSILLLTNLSGGPRRSFILPKFRPFSFVKYHFWKEIKLLWRHEHSTMGKTNPVKRDLMVMLLIWQITFGVSIHLVSFILLNITFESVQSSSIKMHIYRNVIQMLQHVVVYYKNFNFGLSCTNKSFFNNRFFEI